MISRTGFLLVKQGGNMRRIALLICAVAMLLGLLTPCTMAATKAVNYDTSRDYVARIASYIYSAASESNPICSYSRNNRILGVANSNSGWGYNTVFIQVTKGAYTGYTRNNRLIPMSKSYRATSTGYYLKTTAGGNTNAYGSPVPLGTILYYLSKTTSGQVTYYKVRYYGVVDDNGDTPEGYLPSTAIARTYGT